jgi:Protein of unknown function (DUF2587)
VSEHESEPGSAIVPTASGPPAGADGDGEGAPKAVAEPDKLIRITSMVRELLGETRQAPPDERGRILLRDIYERSLAELKDALPEELAEELASLAPPIEGVPTESEIRVAQAQLVGWLEGLFHGIQAAVWAQQMQARIQLEEVRRRGLPPGAPMPSPDQASSSGERETSQYL